VASVRVALALAVGAIALAASLSTPMAQAQATRTWVSGVGDDVNPCSRTAPCKTFAGAISKTAAGGEINCLDPGGYGAVTITKSMTIDCTGTFASILASGTTGVNVNDSATGTPNTIIVQLKCLSINGSGTTLGINGINFVSGAQLVVENTLITDFSNAGINARGVNVSLVYHQLEVINSTIMRNGVGGSGTAGIILGVPAPGAPVAGVVRASIIDSVISHGNVGIRVSPTAVAVLERTSIESNVSYGAVVAGGGGIAHLNASNSNISASIAGTGIYSDGGGTIVRLYATTVTGNAIGLTSVNGGQILSAGNNFIQGNFTANGSPTGPAPQS